MVKPSWWLCFCLSLGAAQAQTGPLSCAGSAVPTLVHAEGLAERLVIRKPGAESADKKYTSFGVQRLKRGLA